jgi:hypothetical protein
MNSRLFFHLSLVNRRVETLSPRRSLKGAVAMIPQSGRTLETANGQTLPQGIG